MRRKFNKLISTRNNAYPFNNFICNLSRIWLLMSSQININSAFEQDLLELKSSFPKEILLLGPCLQYSPMNNTVRCAGKDVYKYPAVLQVRIILENLFP